jgi:hypothetical protein
MKQTGILRQMSALRVVAILCLACGSLVARASQQAPQSVEALIYSTMPSTAAHRPEMAMDGDPNTYFKTVYGMSDGDDFMILLSQPIPVRSLRITTGDADGQDTLTEGYVETSADAIHYSRAAGFDKQGVANVALDGKPVQALRIRVDEGKGAPALAVREIAIDSPVKIAHIQYGPGRGFIDMSQAPDLAEWARTAERQMESFWPDTAALLYTDGFITPNAVNVVYRTGPDVTPVAATGGGVMTVNSKWCREHPDDTGLTVHETAHVIQSTPYNPVWLVEGVADYIRWIKFEPEHYRPRINTRTATYHDSYRTTATFLAWCELHYDSRLVTKLNHDVRFGAYNNGLFKRYCGKDVDTLWAEFVAAYNADPTGIITPPAAAGSRPRPLPAVHAGSSVPVDLAVAYTTEGVAADGANFRESEGFDSGGAAYSATLLGATATWKEVQFRIGPTKAANTVACKGQVIALPAGNYASLWLLGAAVEGPQTAQTFVVTYADGTTAQLVQNLSDWFQPQSFPGESRAVKMAYRNMANGARDGRTFYAYSYGFSLDAAKAVKSITLPDNANVRLLAITLAN